MCVCVCVCLSVSVVSFHCAGILREMHKKGEEIKRNIVHASNEQMHDVAPSFPARRGGVSDGRTAPMLTYDTSTGFINYAIFSHTPNLTN